MRSLQAQPMTPTRRRELAARLLAHAIIDQASREALLADPNDAQTDHAEVPAYDAAGDDDGHP